jgi:hypothetical protein
MRKRKSIYAKDGTRVKSKYEREVLENNPGLRYEPERLEYTLRHTYAYDFLTPSGTPIECKGYFRPGDKRKLLQIRKVEGYDIHLLFMYNRPEMIAWAKKHGFPFAVGTKIPKEWM